MKFKELRKKFKPKHSTCKWLKWFRLRRTCKGKEELDEAENEG